MKWLFLESLGVILICCVSPIKAQPAKRQFGCADKEFLKAANTIFLDKEFQTRGAFDDGPHTCGDLFEIRYVDLNRDGTPEILARGKTTPLCGGVGNCTFYVLKKTSGGYRKLFITTDYVDRSVMGRQAQRSRTRGYANILTTGHIVAGETSFSLARFNGRRYVEDPCPNYEVYDRTVNGKPRFKLVSCRVFHSRLEKQ
jgi:hypothetical protein